MSIKDVPPARLKEIAEDLGWFAVYGMGDVGRPGKLRVGVALDVETAKKVHQTYADQAVQVPVEVWFVGKEVADRVRASIMIPVLNHGLRSRGSWIEMDADELRDLIIETAKLADFKVIKPSERETEILKRYARSLEGV